MISRNQSRRSLKYTDQNSACFETCSSKNLANGKEFNSKLWQTGKTSPGNNEAVTNTYRTNCTPKNTVIFLHSLKGKFVCLAMMPRALLGVHARFVGNDFPVKLFSKVWFMFANCQLIFLERKKCSKLYIIWRIQTKLLAKIVSECT